MPLGADKVRRLFAEILDDEQSAVPLLLKDLLQQHLQDLARLEHRIESIDKQLAEWAKTNQQAMTLLQMLGVGVITATAFAASSNIINAV